MVDSETSELAKANSNETQFILQNKTPNKHKEFKNNVNKYLTIISASLLCISFGTMLGWPSPTYPLLLADDSPIPITLDQSAMVAGMLMNGFVVSTPLSCYDCIGYKASAICAAAVVSTGWLVMAGASDVLALCVSRILIGAGVGFAVGKYKSELKNICNPKESVVHKQLTVLFISLGVCLSFGLGPILSLRMLPILAAIVPAVAFLLSLPGCKRPTNLELRRLETDKTVVRAHNEYDFRLLLMLFWLVVIQQFSGGPPLIVYSQIVFTEIGCPHPQVCAAVYSVIFLVSSYIGLRYTPHFKRRYALSLSYSTTAVLSAGVAFYLWYNPSAPHAFWLPFLAVQLFCLAHTAGSASVMGPLLSDLFPEGPPKFVENFVIMCTAELAVIVTKVFQVLYDRYEMFVPFCLLAATSAAGVFTVVVCMKETKVSQTHIEIT